MREIQNETGCKIDVDTRKWTVNISGCDGGSVDKAEEKIRKLGVSVLDDSGSGSQGKGSGPSVGPSAQARAKLNPGNRGNNAKESEDVPMAVDSNSGTHNSSSNGGNQTISNVTVGGVKRGKRW